MLRKLFRLPVKEDEPKLVQNMIEISGVNQEYINFIHFPIQENEYVHVIIIDDYTIPDKKDLVLLHGLTGTAFCFFTMFKELSKHYRVYALDLPGQGLSSRIPYDFLNRDKAEDYFVERIKKTIDGLKIRSMVLVGHSFSGYIGGLLQVKYPEMIDELILLSPLGLVQHFELQTTNAFQDLAQSIAFKLKRGPETAKLLGILSYPIFSKYLDKSRFRSLNDYEYTVFKNFLFLQINKDCSSDRSIFALFDKHLKAYKPLSLFPEAFKQRKKILILYGDEDWCPSVNGEVFRDLVGKDIIEIDKVPKASHMMQTDNSAGLTEKILKFLGKIPKEETSEETDTETSTKETFEETVTETSTKETSEETVTETVTETIQE